MCVCVPLQKQSRLPAATAPEEVLAGGACVGADCLLRVLGSYSRCGGVKSTLTVGVVGEWAALGGVEGLGRLLRCSWGCC